MSINVTEIRLNMHLTPGMAWFSLLATDMLLYFITIYMLESHHSDIKQGFILEIRIYKFITSQLHSQQVFFFLRKTDYNKRLYYAEKQISYCRWTKIEASHYLNSRPKIKLGLSKEYNTGKCINTNHTL